MQAISAERSIWIAGAYFVPSWSEVEALIGAAHDGVDVRILVPARNDHPWVSFLTRRYYRRHYGYWGPRRYWGPRYGYYGYPYGYPYGYYRPYHPGVAVGIGPFGFRFF